MTQAINDIAVAVASQHILHGRHILVRHRRAFGIQHSRVLIQRKLKGFIHLAIGRISRPALVFHCCMTPHISSWIGACFHTSSNCG
jgi:hypothetical protein